MYNTPYCKVEYLKDKNAIFCEWKQFCKGDDYRNPLRYGAELIAKYQPKIWITDTTNGFESDEADTKWLLEEFVPKMIESSIEKISFVIKNDSPLMDEILGQKEALGEFFEVELVESLAQSYGRDVLSQTFSVKKEDCISDIAEFLPTMLGTYTLVKWMEIVSAKNIYAKIEQTKYITVGQTVNIEHLQMVKLDEVIEVVSTITTQKKRDIFFEIEAFNGQGVLVAKATHKRVLIPLKVVEKVLS